MGIELLQGFENIIDYLDGKSEDLVINIEEEATKKVIYDIFNDLNFSSEKKQRFANGLIPEVIKKVEIIDIKNYSVAYIISDILVYTTEEEQRELLANKLVSEIIDDPKFSFKKEDKELIYMMSRVLDYANEVLSGILDSVLASARLDIYPVESYTLCGLTPTILISESEDSFDSRSTTPPILESRYIRDLGATMPVIMEEYNDDVEKTRNFTDLTKVKLSRRGRSNSI